MTDRIRITIICATSPLHARGKIATVGRFDRAVDGTWDRLLYPRPGGAPVRSLGVLYQTGDGVRTRDRFDLMCELCGPSSHLQIRAETAFRIFDELATRGVSSIELERLATIVS